MTTTRVFFSADCHGSTAVWKKWLRVPSHHSIDVLMLCGDLTGKALVPIIDQGDGTHRAFYFGRNWRLQTEEGIRRMEGRLESAGVYHLRCDRQQVRELQASPGKVSELMLARMAERLREWLDLLLERVDTGRVIVVVMPGNDDDFQIDGIIRSYEDRGIICPLGKVISIGGLEMISLDYVNPTPWNTPREVDETEMMGKIEGLVSTLRDPSRAIFNIHCPPWGTRLDLASKLNQDLKPEVVAGQVMYEHVGSKSVRKAIEQYQPLIGLHGHIHESYGMDKLGSTPVVNPGSEYGEGVLRGFVVELSEKGLENYLRVEG